MKAGGAKPARKRKQEAASKGDAAFLYQAASAGLKSGVEPFI